MLAHRYRHNISLTKTADALGIFVEARSAGGAVVGIVADVTVGRCTFYTHIDICTQLYRQTVLSLKCHGLMVYTYFVKSSKLKYTGECCTIPNVPFKFWPILLD